MRCLVAKKKAEETIQERSEFDSLIIIETLFFTLKKFIFSWKKKKPLLLNNFQMNL